MYACMHASRHLLCEEMRSNEWGFTKYVKAELTLAALSFRSPVCPGRGSCDGSHQTVTGVLGIDGVGVKRPFRFAHEFSVALAEIVPLATARFTLCLGADGAAVADTPRDAALALELTGTARGAMNTVARGALEIEGRGETPEGPLVFIVRRRLDPIGGRGHAEARLEEKEGSGCRHDSPRRPGATQRYPLP